MADKKVYRYSPLYIPISILRDVGGLLFSYLLILYFSKDWTVSFIHETLRDFKSGDFSTKISMIIILIVAAQPLIVAILLTYKTLKWKNTRLILEKTSIKSEYKGLLKKESKEVPLSHISNVNLNSGILYMICGLKDVKIDINSSETAMTEDYSITMKKSDAMDLKNRIKNYNLGLVKSPLENIESDKIKSASKTCISSENTSFDYKFSINQVIRHVLLSAGPFTIIMFCSGIVSSLNNKDGLLFISILIIIKDFITGLNDFYGLRVVADSENIHISHGLTEVKSFDIARKNIISVSTRQDLVARLLGFKCISIDVIGMGNMSGEGNLVSLYMKNNQLEKFASDAGLVIDYIDTEKSNSKETTKTKDTTIFKDKPREPYIEKPLDIIYRYKLTRNILLLPLVLAIVYLINPNPIVLFLSVIGAFILVAVEAIVSTNMTNVYMSPKKLVIIRGIMSKSTEIIPYTRIDMVEKKQNIFQKRLKLASLNVYMRDHKTGKTVESTGLYREDTFDSLIDYYVNGEK